MSQTVDVVLRAAAVTPSGARAPAGDAARGARAAVAAAARLAPGLPLALGEQPAGPRADPPEVRAPADASRCVAGNIHPFTPPSSVQDREK